MMSTYSNGVYEDRSNQQQQQQQQQLDYGVDSALFDNIINSFESNLAQTFESLNEPAKENAIVVPDQMNIKRTIVSFVLKSLVLLNFFKDYLKDGPGSSSSFDMHEPSQIARQSSTSSLSSFPDDSVPNNSLTYRSDELDNDEKVKV